MTAVDVVTVGEPLVAFVAAATGPLALATRFDAHVVGSETNTAVGLSRLGITTALVALVGDDPFGRRILRDLRAEQVDCRAVTAVPGYTGTLVRGRRGGGASEVVYQRTHSAGSTLTAPHIEQHADLLQNARRVHLSGVTPALSMTCRGAVERALALANTAGVPVSFDVNMRRTLWTAEQARAVSSFHPAAELGVTAGRPSGRA